MTTTLGLRRLSLSLMAGTAAVALGHTAAAQDTEIDNDTTTPVVTSTDGDVTVTGDGSITVTDGPAITIDSDNDVVLDGEIIIDDPAEDGTTAEDGAGAVLITNDATFDYSQSGDIEIQDDSPLDEEPDDADGITPTDFADDRYGLRLGAGNYTGNISLTESASITFNGDNSFGLDIIGNLTTAAADTAALFFNGDIIVRGENSVGIQISGDVTGDVTLDEGATINVLGKDSDAVNIDGNIDGAFEFDGSIAVTGFQDQTPASEIDDEDTTDVDEGAEGAQRNNVQKALTSGHGISIGGNITGGVLLDGPLPSEFNEVPDQSASTSVTIRGSGNALRIDGGMTGSTIGLVDNAAIDDARDTVEDNDIPEYGDYGVVNRAALTAIGTYEGIASETVYIANANIAGGLRNDGNIDAQADRAAATGLRLGPGAVLPEIYNRGRISSGVFGSGGDSIAIQIDAGADVASLENESTIEAFALSDDRDVVAIRDESGTLTNIVNAGTITAFLGDDNDNDPDTTEDEPEPVGEAIALDLRANTTGVTITNTVTSRPNIDVEAIGRASFGNVVGNVYTGTGDDMYIADAGTTNGDLYLDAGNDTVRLSMTAGIIGDIYFGDGNDQLLLDEGAVAGDIDFGAGNSILSLDNGSAFVGDVSSDGSVDIDIRGSSLFFGSDTNLNVGTLTASTIPAAGDEAAMNSVLGFSISEGGTGIAQLNAANVTLEAGTGIRTVFDGAFTQDIEATIISAGSLDIDGGVDALVLNEAGVTPIIFQQSLTTANGGNDLVLNLRRKSADELGIAPGLAGAYNPVVAALTADDTLGSALFNATTIEEFDELFYQVVAGPLDAPMAYARAQNSSVTSLVAQRVEALRTTGEARPRRFWLQEEGFFLNRDSDDASNGFDGGGFVVALGADAPIGPIDVVGVSVHFASARYDEQLGEDFPFDRTTYGADLYYAEQLGNFELDGRVGFALSNNTSERSIDFGNGADFFEGEWDGTQITANSKLKYRHSMGKTDISPFVSMDFVSITDDEYTETGNETLILTAEEREAESLRANIGFEISRTFTPGQNRVYEFSSPGTLRPRLTAAWSQELITDDYEATYNFGQPGENEQFTLFSEAESGAAILGADMLYENDYATVHVGVSGHLGEQTEILTLRAGIGLKW